VTRHEAHAALSMWHCCQLHWATGAAAWAMGCIEHVAYSTPYVCACYDRPRPRSADSVALSTIRIWCENSEDAGKSACR
jgi:hypothetical protein